MAIEPRIAFGYMFVSTELDELSLPLHSFSFRVPGTRRLIEVDVVGAQLGIFRLGVGFVCLELRPRSAELADWLDALHFLRFYRGRGERLTPLRRPEDTDELTDRLKIENVLAPVLAAAELESEVSPFGTREALDAGKRPGGYVKELYVPGELLTYAALFVEGVPDGDRFRILRDVLHRYRASGQAEPAVEDADEGWRLSYQKDQQFLVSIQGSAFVAFDAEPIPFNYQTLPANLRTTYFVLFLLALLQRFALDQLSEAVARSTGRVLAEPARGRAREELERVTALDARLLDFTGRCYFVQVSQVEHHHRYYARLREVNQIEDRYREVTEEVRALRAHAESRVRAEEDRTSLRVAAALMVITCVLLPLQVIEALFSTKLADIPGVRGLSPTWSAVAAGGVLFIALTVAILIVRGTRWKSR